MADHRDVGGNLQDRQGDFGGRMDPSSASKLRALHIAKIYTQLEQSEYKPLAKGNGV